MSVSFKMTTLFIGVCVVGICSGNMGDVDSEPKFVLNFDSPPYVCADDDSESRVDTSGIEVVNYNETLNYLDGYVKFLQDIDTNLLTVLKTEKQISGQFETMLTHEICNLCDELHEGSTYYKYLRNIGFPECPFAAGEYPITNLKSDDEDFPMTSSNAGRYLITISFFTTADGLCTSDKTFLMCFKISFCIEPVE